MRRRDFIKAVAGSAMTWPLVVRAQQAMPAIGLLTPVLQIEEHLRGFQRGLQRAGLVEGDNVSILYRSAENETDRQALRQILMMHGCDVIPPAAQTGRMFAEAVADHRVYCGLVGHDPVLDAVAQAF